MTLLGYSKLMNDQPAHLTLKLDTSEPVEIGDFVGAFTSLANEFEEALCGRDLCLQEIKPKFQSSRPGVIELLISDTISFKTLIFTCRST